MTRRHDDRPVSQVWWASPRDSHPYLEHLLDEHEQARLASFRLIGDRERHLVGAALSRVLAGLALGRHPATVSVDRTCRCGEHHGKPRIAGFHHSVSHSDDVVAVAVSAAPVGVDVERIVQLSTVARLIERTLTGVERAELRACDDEALPGAFTRYWTRKEAILKATGEGLRIPFRSVEVTGPTAPPAILRWHPPHEQYGVIAVHDLRPPAGFEGAIAVLDPTTAGVETHDGSRLLAEVVARGGSDARPPDSSVCVR